MDKNAVKFIDEVVEAKFMLGGKRSGGWVSTSEADEMMDTLIEYRCGQGCADTKRGLQSKNLPYSIEFLADNLPAVQYVAQFYLELITHGGLLAKDVSNQEKLDKWLNRRNILNQTNANVIRQALLSSIIYGYSGLRRIENDVVYIGPNHFKIWKLPAYIENRQVPGVYKPYYYEIFKKAETAVEKTDAEAAANTKAEFKRDRNLKEGVDGSYYVGEKPANATAVFVPAENFTHLRHSDEGDYGVSPLSKDRLRTTLIVDYIINVIDEVSNDGNDYMIYLKARSNVGNSLANMISSSAASATIGAAVDSKERKNEAKERMDAARVLATKMKRSEKTRFNIINKTYIDEVDRLPGTVDLSKYISILNNAKATVADIYGIAAMLAGSDGGGWSTGMSALIPFTLERTIKPFQQRYAEQLTPMVASCAGIKGGVTFKEINWEDEKTQAEIEKLRADTEKALAEANKYKAEEAKTKKETKQLGTTATTSTSTTTSK